MVNHRALRIGPFWAPPGGGLEFGCSAKDKLMQEFKEETGLDIQVGPQVFVTEFIHPPLHALELFFGVTVQGGSLRTGHDPEMAGSEQIIQDVRFLTFDEIDALPAEEKHGAFGLVGRAGEIGGLNGYFMI